MNASKMKLAILSSIGLFSMASYTILGNVVSTAETPPADNSAPAAPDAKPATPDAKPAPTDTKPAADPKAVDDSTTIYATQVQPILNDNCLRCHGPGRAMGGLRLDTREAILAGGRHGPSAVSGSPETSNLIHVVKQDSGYPPMPIGGKLTDKQIAVLEHWVKIGLPWGPAPAAPKP